MVVQQIGRARGRRPRPPDGVSVVGAAIRIIFQSDVDKLKQSIQAQRTAIGNALQRCTKGQGYAALAADWAPLNTAVGMWLAHERSALGSETAAQDYERGEGYASQLQAFASRLTGAGCEAAAPTGPTPTPGLSVNLPSAAGIFSGIGDALLIFGALYLLTRGGGGR